VKVLNEVLVDGFKEIRVMLDKAILIAAQAHLGQKDKMDGAYVLHPLRMMLRFQSEAEMIVAVLHDVVEDNPDWTLDRLRQEGFSEEIVQAIDHLTRREDESYEEFTERAGRNALARRVKLADLEDNMDIRRYPAELRDKDKDKLARYHKAWLKLTGSN
jgi:(p)ppGpp synthase/HD superfamily hydrolase